MTATFFEGELQMPGVAFGRAVENLPPEVDSLYSEARNCMAVNAFTAAVLACRKMLMNVAVAKGAEAGRQFAYYVEYLGQKGYVPANASAWIDHLRSKGNEATHEIHVMSRADACEILTFIEMLLKIVFEFPAKIT